MLICEHLMVAGNGIQLLRVNKFKFIEYKIHLCHFNIAYSVNQECTQVKQLQGQTTS